MRRTRKMRKRCLNCTFFFDFSASAVSANNFIHKVDASPYLSHSVSLVTDNAWPFLHHPPCGSDNLHSFACGLRHKTIMQESIFFAAIQPSEIYEICRGFFRSLRFIRKIHSSRQENRRKKKWSPVIIVKNTQNLRNAAAALISEKKIVFKSSLTMRRRECVDIDARSSEMRIQWMKVMLMLLWTGFHCCCRHSCVSCSYLFGFRHINCA